MTVPLFDPFAVSSDGTEAKAEKHPTQEQLVALVAEHRNTLQVIEIHADFGSPLNFSEGGCLPALKSLSLRCVNIVTATFTEDNTPALETLELNNIEEHIHIHLDLPNLTSLTVEHTWSDYTPNDLGNSLTRCPKLQSLHSYKFRGLCGKNFCVLPSMESMGLWRAELLEHLEILSAPLLENLDIEEATSLDVLRLWDLPAAKPADALSMNTAGCAAKVKKAVQAVRARKVPDAEQQEAPTLCEINAVGVELSPSTFEHLMANERVTVNSEDNFMDEIIQAGVDDLKETEIMFAQIARQRGGLPKDAQDLLARKRAELEGMMRDFGYMPRGTNEGVRHGVP